MTQSTSPIPAPLVCTYKGCEPAPASHPFDPIVWLDLRTLALHCGVDMRTVLRWCTRDGLPNQSYGGARFVHLANWRIWSGTYFFIIKAHKP